MSTTSPTKPAPFRIVRQPRAWWPVTWTGVAESGDLVENRIELRFHLLKVDAASVFLADVFEAEMREREPGADLPAMYAGLVMRVADDWRNVHGENDQPLPWSEANLRLLMNEGGMFGHVFRAFRACLAGERETREGN